MLGLLEDMLQGTPLSAQRIDLESIKDIKPAPANTIMPHVVQLHNDCCVIEKSIDQSAIKHVEAE